MDRAPRIGVMGPGKSSREENEAAYMLGRKIAQSGGMLICGGLGGVMEAASRGAWEAGGVVVGILPGTDAEAANPYVTVPVVTGMSHARNAINIWTSQVVIAVGGAYGTLSEIALALKAGKPVIVLNSWRLNEIGVDDPLFHVADSPEQAVAKALELITGGR